MLRRPVNTAPQVQKANNELETTKGKIRQIYKIHSPETNVDDVLHRYQGKEQQLLAGCRAAWEQAPSQSMPPFPSQPSRPPKASSSTIAPSQPAQNVRPSQRAPLSQPPQSQRALPLNRQTVLTQPRAPPPKASTIPSDRIPPPPPPKPMQPPAPWWPPPPPEPRAASTVQGAAPIGGQAVEPQAPKDPRVVLKVKCGAKDSNFFAYADACIPVLSYTCVL